MTASDFSRYLQQPRLLYELPLTELQQLSLRFPYSPNLRLLLLLKAHLEGHPQEADYLARCAAATFDRGTVYDVLQELDVVMDEEASVEEVLELRELDDLIMEAEPTLPDPPAALAEDLPMPVVETKEEDEADDWGTFTDDDETEEEDAHYGDLPLTEEDVQDTAEVPPVIVQEKPEPAAAPTFSAPEEVEKTKTPTHKVTGATGYGTLQERLAKIRSRQETQRKDTREDVNRIARRSLVAQEEVASETLAKLLVRQGQYQNAIKMYQRLILLYPEKKPTFAGLIKELKEKL